LAGERLELIAPSKGGPHPPLVSGATPETTRGTRVLPYLSPRIHPSVRLFNLNAASYFLSVKQ